MRVWFVLIELIGYRLRAGLIDLGVQDDQFRIRSTRAGALASISRRASRGPLTPWGLC